MNVITLRSDINGTHTAHGCCSVNEDGGLLKSVLCLRLVREPDHAVQD